MTSDIRQRTEIDENGMLVGGELFEPRFVRYVVIGILLDIDGRSAFAELFGEEHPHFASLAARYSASDRLQEQLVVVLHPRIPVGHHVPHVHDLPLLRPQLIVLQFDAFYGVLLLFRWKAKLVK